MRSSASPFAAPYIPFILFLTANTLLSYFSFSTVTKLWIFFFGILLPLIFSLLERSPNKPHSEEVLPIPLWAWGLAGLAGISLRLYQIVHIPWFISDDGLMSYYSIALAHHWTWHCFFSPEQHPPFFNWLLTAY